MLLALAACGFDLLVVVGFLVLGHEGWAITRWFVWSMMFTTWRLQRFWWRKSSFALVTAVVSSPALVALWLPCLDGFFDAQPRRFASLVPSPCFGSAPDQLCWLWLALLWSFVWGSIPWNCTAAGSAQAWLDA
ncbi:hypothetical protein U1Q18_013691 [Sarracenia purpurea var. burkii]